MEETKQAKTLQSPEEVMRRAYGTKLESLRRRELEILFQIHGIKHGDLIKDDLVKVGQAYEAMGYDLWKRPEEQPPPRIDWPGGTPDIVPTPSDPIESSGKGRTTRDVIEGNIPEHPPAVPPGDPLPEPEAPDEVAADEWDILKGVGFADLRAMTKELGLDQSNTDKRQDLTTRIMISTPRHKVEEWIAQHGKDKDAS